jgi:AraC-like DNA-binding protein
MDALSDVLRAVRLTGAVFFDVRASEPWVAEAPSSAAIIDRCFPEAQHLVHYHVVTDGRVWAGLGDGGASVQLEAGDVIVFPHGDAHVLGSAPGVRGTLDLARFDAVRSAPRPFAIAMGEGTATSAHFVCGFLTCDARPFNPLLSALPRVMHVRGAQGGATEALVRFALAEGEDRRPGSDIVLGRLSELMFLDVVRRYLASLPPDRTGWLAGLQEPFVGRALAALHRDPTRDWTIESLAREVALSRSALAERFTQLVGLPPMQYLANWRMQLAANHLLAGTDSVATIADRVGYESEAAFSRAFKKVVGAPPGVWRKHRMQAARA